MMNSKISSTSSEEDKQSAPAHGPGPLFTSPGADPSADAGHGSLSSDPAAENKMTGSKNANPSLTEKAAKSEKDYILKLETAQALCAAGYFVRTNVALSETSLSSKGAQKLVDITDVDVLGVSYASDFHPDTVCVSCKAGGSKSLSPIKETLMMAGVMQYLRADRGYAVFADRKIDPHMYALAQQLRIGLFSLEEWKLWKGRSVGTKIAPAHFRQDVYVGVRELISKRNDLDGLLAYTRGEYWYYRDFRNIQNLVAMTRKYSKPLSNSPVGTYVFYDMLSLFALSVLQLCEFVTFSGISRLVETLPPYLFGGSSVYKSRRELLKRVEEMLRERDVLRKDQHLPSLDPPYVQELAEMVTRLVQKPVDAVRVPQHINFTLGSSALLAIGSAVSADSSGESVTSQKFAVDLGRLFCQATGVSAKLLDIM